MYHYHFFWVISPPHIVRPFMISVRGPVPITQIISLTGFYEFTFI